MVVAILVIPVKSNLNATLCSDILDFSSSFIAIVLGGFFSVWFTDYSEDQCPVA